MRLFFQKSNCAILSEAACLRDRKADSLLIHIVNSVVVFEEGQSEEPLVPTGNVCNFHGDVARLLLRNGVETLTWNVISLALDCKAELWKLLNHQSVGLAVHCVPPIYRTVRVLPNLSDHLPELALWQEKIRRTTVNDSFPVMCEWKARVRRVLQDSVLAKFDFIELDRPEILAEIPVPSQVLDGELRDVVPAESCVADRVVAGETEREDTLVNGALLLSELKEEVGSIIANLHR